MNKAKILIVDDEKEVLEHTQHFLEKHLVCDADIALSGEEALKKIKAAAYDVVLLDVKMPGLSGIDVLRRLKNDNIKLDVLMMTAYNSRQVGKEVLEEGALGCLVKPIPTEKMLEEVKAILAKKGKLFTNGAGAE